MVQPPATMVAQMSTMRMSNGTTTPSASSSNTPKSRMSGSVVSQSFPNPTTTTNGSSSIPLSSRKSAPLDLSTVELRGLAAAANGAKGKQRVNPAHPPKTSRPQGLQEAPTYHPTEEEFREGPIAYINRIRDEASKYGIVKIVPPDGWSPPFAIDTEHFHFRTRKQELNQTDGGTRANLSFLDALSKWHKQNSNYNLARFPSVDKRPLDLYKLKKLVEDKGGFENVCKGKRWAEIGRDLGYSGKIMSSLSTSLKNSYQKWLEPYENYLATTRPAVIQAQQEREHGTPYTPSPGPLSNSNTPKVQMKGESAMKASQILHAQLESTKAPIIESTPPPPPQPTGGFTAVNSGGFTAVNAPSSGFAAINAPNGYQSNGHATPQGHSPGPSTPSMLAGTSISSNLKRPASVDAETLAGGSGDDETRHPKRSRKGDSSAPTVLGSQMIQPRLPGAMFAFPRDRSNDQPGDCDVCGKGKEAGENLACDTCETTFHNRCLDPPPTTASSDGEWHCPRCLVGAGDYGFEDGGIYSLKQFQEKASNFKKNHFAKKLNEGATIPTEEEVEEEFWRLTDSLTETVEVEYGADIHSTTHGSGFPTIERNPFNPYSVDPWNLNVMPLEKESLFRHIKSDISGMTVPWDYVGMVFSTFCWHNEDHYTYSANYQHFGETKTWYGIPSSSAERFEAAMREAVPELFEQQPDLLFQLVTLLQPEKLQKAGVEVFALDQRAGEFVITFPQAYHAGFNHGFNFNEAVNFAPADWEPFGAAAIQRLQQFKRQPVFSHEELLFTAAARDHSIKTSKWLGPALEKVQANEMQTRELIQNAYKLAIAESQGVKPDEELPTTFPYTHFTTETNDEETVCIVCKSYSYLSRYVCKMSDKVLCLAHAVEAPCCTETRTDKLLMVDGLHEVRLLMTDEELGTTVRKVVDIAKTPEAWIDKLDALLEDEPRPALRSLRILVVEGERIGASWPLSRLAEVKEFVQRCNQWVEEATAFIARKPAGRRKSEMRSRSSADEAKRKEEKDALRNPDNIKKLLKEADNLSFDCPELEKLQERYDRIYEFRKRARIALRHPHITSAELEEIIEEGKDIDMDMAEMSSLDTRARTVQWFVDAKEHSEKMSQGKPLSLEEVDEFIEQGKKLDVRSEDGFMLWFIKEKEKGEFWERKAKEVMASEPVNFHQLDAIFKQASNIPVSSTTKSAIDEMLKKQREAQERIMILYERTKDLNFRKRPMYRETRDTMTELEEINSKPPGTLDLERELKRHEDWMRRGKKLFGKANAPLHILLQHMQAVQERNAHCLDLRDQPRPPMEPASREQSPEDGIPEGGSHSSRDVFCICRKPESGMMIECELCHEWYHGRCLKIARGKVKEDDKYTCPICDYRVKIPRDAARPKLEELLMWQEEITGLPFQPEEEEMLSAIIEVTQEFRGQIQYLINPISTGPEDLPVQRFFLRKIEGADVLLAPETNFLRQEVHKWAPVAPEPPRLIEVSLSTRKPRPTKTQKLMAKMGVNDINELPEHLRPKPPKNKKFPFPDGHRSGKGSMPANPSANAKPGESISVPRPYGNVPDQIPGPRASHSATGSVSTTNDATPGTTNADAATPNPSAFPFDRADATGSAQFPASPASPLFASTSVSHPYLHHSATPGSEPRDVSAGPTGAGGSSIDPALESLFAQPSGHHLPDSTSPELERSRASVGVNGNSSGGGGGARGAGAGGTHASGAGDHDTMDLLFVSLTNGGEGDYYNTAYGDEDRERYG